MNTRILIAETRDFSPEALEMLRHCGEVELHDIRQADVKNALSQFDVLWFRLGFQIRAQDLPAASRCRYIVCPATGLDHIDEQACTEKGIRILSLRGEQQFLRNVTATAEHTIGLALALLRQIPTAAEHVNAGGWNRDLFKGRELSGKTVGIAGVGRLGSMTARYFQAFGCKVLGYDIKAYECPGVVPCGSLEELVALSDIVSVHINFVPENVHLLNKKLISQFKTGAWLINTSRGGLVDETALLDALLSGKLAGAALDVLENEQEARSEALLAYAGKHSNLLITPHIGGNTAESFEKTEKFMAQKLSDALQGKNARNILAIIPAREGSKRVPNKNIRPFAGSSLSALAIEQAQKSQRITHIALSSDSAEILSLAASMPEIFALKRPKAISGDDAPAIAYVRHALSCLETNGLQFDAVVILQPSSPLRTPADIDATIDVLLQHPEADSAVSAVRLDHMVHPVKIKTLDRQELKPYFEAENGRFAAADLPPAYVRNCAVYATWRAGLETRPDVIGEKSMAYLMPPERSVDINEMLDFEFAEYLYLKNRAAAT